MKLIDNTLISKNRRKFSQSKIYVIQFDQQINLASNFDSGIEIISMFHPVNQGSMGSILRLR